MGTRGEWDDEETLPDICELFRPLRASHPGHLRVDPYDSDTALRRTLPTMEHYDPEFWTERQKTLRQATQRIQAELARQAKAKETRGRTRRAAQRRDYRQSADKTPVRAL